MSKKVIQTAKTKAYDAGKMAAWCMLNNQEPNVWFDLKVRLVNSLVELEIVTDWGKAYEIIDTAFDDGKNSEYIEQSRKV